MPRVHAVSCRVTPPTEDLGGHTVTRGRATDHLGTMHASAWVATDPEEVASTT